MLEASHDRRTLGPKEQTTEEGVDLGGLVATIWRRKWLIIGTTLASAALAYVLVSQITPHYKARASVMLDGRSVQVLESTDVVSDLNLSNPVLDSEVTILQSNILLRDVLGSFEPDALAPLDPALDPPGLVNRIAKGLMTVIEPMLPITGEVGPAADDGAEMITPETRRMRRLTNALRKAMTVWREGQSYVISVSIETESPQLSMQLANRIVETYVGRQLEMRQDVVRGANSFLQTRVDTMRAEVERSEAAVEDFRRNQLDDGGASLESLERQLVNLATQIAIASADLATAEARASQIRSVVEDDGIEAAAELLTSPFVLSLRQEKSELEREELRLSNRLPEDHPDRVQTRAAINAISETLSEEVRQIIATMENDARVAAIREQSLRDSLTELEQRMSDLSRASLELRQLEREAEAVRASYEAALIRASETQSVEQLQRADAVIIERAQVPGAPSSPRTMLFTALGGTAGFGLGLITTVLLALFGAGFTRMRDLEQATGLPVVAALPVGRWRSVRRLLASIERMPYQAYVERLRQLRSALDGEGAPRTILMTSCVPIEGKTTLSVAFAKLESMSGKSCILLDFDMRRSVLARDLKYAPKGGDLTDLLSGRSDVDASICSDAKRGFDLLTSRKPAPQLFDRVGSDELGQLIGDLSKRYDRVVIDTAPVLAVADTMPIVRHAEATVLIVRTRMTPQSAVTETLWRLRNMGSRNINLVFSMVEGRESGESYGADTPYLKA